MVRWSLRGSGVVGGYIFMVVVVMMNEVFGGGGCVGCDAVVWLYV